MLFDLSASLVNTNEIIFDNMSELLWHHYHNHQDPVFS